MKLFKNIVLSISIINVGTVFAVADPNNIAIKLAKQKGDIVYSGCVLFPPTTPPQKAACATKYNVYKAALVKVAAPTALSPNTTPSATSWSEYDPCKYDAAAFVYDNPTAIPYCPSI